MNSIHIKSLFLLLVLVLVGCREDSYTEEVETQLPPVITSVETNISGMVSTEDGEPVVGAKVTAREKSTVTDANGYFSINSVVLDANSSVITVKKEGHYNAIKNVFPTKQGRSVVQIALVEKKLTATLQSSSGGTVDISDGVSVQLPAAAYVTASGDSYSGVINVYTHYYDPTEGATLLTMPGNLGGRDSDDNRVQLGTYGMIAVEMETPTGAPLQLADQTATIRMSIPTELQSDAPSQIPLWHFDEEAGIWLEEGTADNIDGTYVGTVSHFSFWNCDRPWPAIKLTLRLVGPDGAPLANKHAYILAEGVGGASGTTNIEGIMCGFVPKDVDLTLIVRSCGEHIVEEELGSLSSDTDLGDVEVEFLIRTTVVNGRMVDCLGLPNEDAYGVLKSSNYSNQLISAEADGSFSTVVTACSNTESTVQFYDVADLTTSSVETVDLNILTNELGDISICDNLDEYLTFTVDGGEEALLTEYIVDYADGNLLRIQSLTSQAGRFDMDLLITAPGDASSTYVNSFSTQSGEDAFYECTEETGTCDQFIVTVLSLGDQVGDYVTGTFAGTLYVTDNENNPDIGGEPRLIEGQFRLKIDYAYVSGSITGLVWYDNDVNGIRSSDETLVLPNGRLTLRNNLVGEEEVILRTSTNEDGTYLIDKVRPGDYLLQLSQTGGLGITLTDIGDDDTDNDFYGSPAAGIVTDVTVQVGEALTNLDAGLLPSESFSMRVNYRGCADETRIRVSIITGAPPYAISIDGIPVLTTIEENFDIDVMGGTTYSVTGTDAFSNSETEEIYVPVHGTRISLDVFEDTAPNINGKLDFGEPILEEVTVEVYDTADQLVTSITTDEPLFADDIEELVAGDYYFRVVTPAGYDIAAKSTENQGNMIDPNTGRSDVYEVFCNGYRSLYIGLIKQ